MWVDYRGSLSTVYNDGEISTCGWIIEAHSVRSTMKTSVNVYTCTLIALIFFTRINNSKRAILTRSDVSWMWLPNSGSNSFKMGWLKWFSRMMHKPCTHNSKQVTVSK